jgi:hypothetical protein
VQDIKDLKTKKPLKKKNRNQLCGGTEDCEFYGTYSQFEPICVFTQDQLESPDIARDHPINLRSEELLEDASLLP